MNLPMTAETPATAGTVHTGHVVNDRNGEPCNRNQHQTSNSPGDFYIIGFLQKVRRDFLLRSQEP